MSVFSPSAETTTAVEVRSLNQGGVIGPGQSLSFLIHQEGAAAGDLQLEIILTDSRGNGVWSRTLSDPAVNEELELLLPELEPGQYEILFRVGGAGSTADGQQLSFFYVRGSYAVTGLSSYPPSTLPGAEIVIQADLDVPEDADPYVRWTQGPRVLARGLLSEGLEAITWKAPREPGVYPVTVELFPVPPVGAGDYPFSSALAMTARLYIGPGASLSARTLLPQGSYYSLFHFDGSLQDSGRAAAGSDAVPVAELFGGAGLVSTPPTGGLRIGPGSGMRYPRLILPMPGTGDSDSGTQTQREGGAAAVSWTLTLALLPDGEPREAMLLTTRSGDGGFGLALRFDPAGSLRATLRTSAGAALELPSGMPPLQAGAIQRIDLSLYARHDTVTAVWFLDGLQTAALVRTAEIRPITGAGETTLGGENGFSGVVTELGVYFLDELGRRAVDPAIYKAAMQARFGSSLILAEGFEGLYLPPGFLLEGSASLGRGALSLGSSADPAADAAGGPAATASRLATPLFELRLPATLIEIEARSGFPAGSRIVLQWEEEDQGFAEIRARRGSSGAVSGVLLDPRAPEAGGAFDRLPDSLLLRLDGQTLTVGAGKDGTGGQGEPVSLEVYGPGEGGGWLKVSLLAPAGGAVLDVDRILIYSASNP